MKKLAAALTGLLLMAGWASAAAPKKLYLQEVNSLAADNQAAAGTIAYFRGRLYERLRKELPCVSLFSNSDAAGIISWERKRVLLAASAPGSDSATLQSIGEAMGARYLLTFRVSGVGNQALFYVSLIDSLKGKTIFRDNAASEVNAGAIEIVEKMADKAVRELAYIEVCPYKGSVKVNVDTRRNEKGTVSTTDFCNNSEQAHLERSQREEKSTEDWEIQRTGNPNAVGTLKADISAKFFEEKEVGCYDCGQGRMGGRISKVEAKSTARVEGISDKSAAYGKDIKDAMVIVNFNRDDTYMVTIKAASDPAGFAGEKETREEATGTCGNIRPRVVKTKLEAQTIPLEVSLGPFTGTPFDKRLTGTKVITEPEEQEGQTNASRVPPKEIKKTTVSFDLSRD